MTGVSNVPPRETTAVFSSKSTVPTERFLNEERMRLDVVLSNQDRLASSPYLVQIMTVGGLIWIADVLAGVLAITCGMLVVLALGFVINHRAVYTLVSIMAFSASYWASGLYPGIGLHPARELRQLFRATFCASATIVLGVGLSTSWASPYVLSTVIGFPFALLLLPVLRGFARRFMQVGRIAIPFYFLGNRRDVMQAYRDMNRFGWAMLKPVGRFANNSDQDGWDSASADDEQFEWRFEQQVEYLGTPDLAAGMAKLNHVYWLFVVGNSPEQLFEKHAELQGAFPTIVFSRAARSMVSACTSMMNCGLTSGVRLEESLHLPWPRFVKRTTDVLISGLLLLVLSPLFFAIAALIRVTSPGPIFFSHCRLGRHGKEFQAWKFRSMVQNASELLREHLERYPELRAEWLDDQKLKSDPRVTWIGKILRRTSLDELPQLWNVLIGEMSLVGPRPIVHEEIVKYGDTFRDYLRVTPGITGLWQISGRNNTTYAERLMYDEYYVRHWSVWMDIYILFRTARTVLFCEGAY